MFRKIILAVSFIFLIALVSSTLVQSSRKPAGEGAGGTMFRRTLVPCQASSLYRRILLTPNCKTSIRTMSVRRQKEP